MESSDESVNHTAIKYRIRKSDPLRWPEEITVAFVKQYLSHECLWNHSSPQYKDKTAKLVACQSIVDSMDLPGFGINEYQSKIRSLRSTYSQELKKIKKAKERGRDFVPSLRWFNLMHNAISRADEEDEAWATCKLGDDSDQQNDYQILFVEDNDDRKGLKRSISQTESVSSGEPDHEVKMSCHYDRIGNEFDLFGKYISVQLQNMPLRLALEAQQHIQTYLTQTRLDNIPIGDT